MVSVTEQRRVHSKQELVRFWIAAGSGFCRMQNDKSVTSGSVAEVN
jgi:hypothetical protein